MKKLAAYIPVKKKKILSVFIEESFDSMAHG